MKSGTSDWVEFEAPIAANPLDRTFAPLLRSDSNGGTAWFDDVEVVDAVGNVMRRFTFDKGPETFRPERAPTAAMSYDPDVGHDKPGSLRVSGTETYNGWIADLFKTYGQKQTYTIRGWMKLENATGRTYVCAAMRGIDSPEIDVGDLRRLLSMAVEFGKRHDVPLWVGEFSAAKNSGPDGYQINSVRERIRLFEEFGIHWTYWNYRESTHPDSMALHAMDKQGNDSPINEPLLDLLKDGFAGRIRPQNAK